MDGICIEYQYFRNECIKITTQYKNNLKHGLSIDTLGSIHNYYEGKQHGDQLDISRFGLTTKYTMIYGVYDGLYTVNDKNGDVEIKKFYINGKKHGESLNKTIHSTRRNNFNHDKLEGEQYVLYHNGV